jgi:cobalt/nickel transport system ATP-binding protein
MTVRDLWHRYGPGAWVLRGVDLTIERQERLALLGANGAGKSTLLHAMAGLIGSERGQVDRHANSVGLVLQDPDDQLFGATVAEDVALGLIDRRVTAAETDRRVAQVLHALGLGDRADAAVHSLSLGQRKRVALAGILVLEPAVVLLDEPTSGLDPYGVDELLALLEQLRQSGTAIVITTHDTTLAAQWADRVFVLHDGRVLAHGAPARVLTDVRVLSTARLRRPAPLERASRPVAV